MIAASAPIDTIDIAFICFLVHKGKRVFIESSAILGGSTSRQRIEQFHEARLVRITHGGAAIWLDPFGMLDPQVVVNLLPELGVGVDLVRHGNWLIWNVHLSSPPLSRLPSSGVGSLHCGTGFCVS